MATYLIGVDLGTSSVKSILVSTRGDLISTVRFEYPMRHPMSGWAEYDPNDWLLAVKRAVKEVADRAAIRVAEIAALCLVGQRDPVVLLGADGDPVAPSISWTDRRDLGEAESLFDRLGRDRLLSLSGVHPVPGLGLPVLWWWKQHQPDVWRRVRRILFAKDYVLYQLTGNAGTDTTTPSRSCLYDLRVGRWADDVCKEIGVDPGLLPSDFYYPWDVWGRLQDDIARSLNLGAGMIVAAGGGDDQSAALGTAAISDGDMCIGTGTTGSVRWVTTNTRPDQTGRADLSPHVIPEQYLYDLAMPGTGSSLRWFRDTFAEPGRGRGMTYEEIIDKAADAPVGADGLVFCPYLEGLPRSHEAAGAFLSILPHHKYAHFARAVLEAVAYQYPAALAEQARYEQRQPECLTLVDEEASSSLWNQVKADVTGKPIRIPQILRASALGASMLAGLAAGTLESPSQAAREMVHWRSIVEPNVQLTERYNALRRRHEQAMGGLTRIHTEIGTRDGAKSAPRRGSDGSKGVT